MKEIRDKIERHRRITDDLILASTVRMNTEGKANNWKEVDALLKSIELQGKANHFLWLAQLVLDNA